MPLKSKLELTVVANLTAALDLASASVPLSKVYRTSLLSGTGAGQADKIFYDQRTLNASATENLDLAGTLVDALGATFTLAKVKGLIVAAAAANTNNVLVGGDVTNTFFPMFGAETDSVIVRPGGVFAVFCGEGDAAGYAVTAGTADLLKVANSGGGTPVTYDVIIIGTSA